MYSTTTIVKNSKLNGRILGTHQRLDLAARRSLARLLGNKNFPSGKEIIHFEGTRGPDGLKRKSPGEDEPSHMLVDEKGDFTLEKSGPAHQKGHERLDQRSVLELVRDHRCNLVKALREKNEVRAAFEAAWMAHMVTDSLTPAHHFPLEAVREELMTDKEMLKVFGEPIKGMVHGRNVFETLRNNWLYWGAKGHMTQHVGYEYGVLMITATLPLKRISRPLRFNDLRDNDFEAYLVEAIDRVRAFEMYERFRRDGWTTELAIETQNILLPEIAKAVALGWFSAAVEAYPDLKRKVIAAEKKAKAGSRADKKTRAGQVSKTSRAPHAGKTSRVGQEVKNAQK